MVDKCITFLTVVSLIGELSFYPLLAEETKEEKIPDKGKIVVKVNGVPLWDKDVYSRMPQLEAGPEMERYKENMLQEAIKKELLYQEAKKQELDKNPSYEEFIHPIDKKAQESGVKYLAAFFVGADENLQKSLSVIEAEITSYISSIMFNQEQSYNQEQVNNDFPKKMLENPKIVQAYNSYMSYMKNIIDRIEVKINEKPLSVDILTAALDNCSSSLFPTTTVTPGQSKEILFPKVYELAVGKEAKSDVDARKAIQDTMVTIGTSSFRLGDYEHLSTILNPLGYRSSAVQQSNREIELLEALLNHILAEEAKRVGLDKDPRWISEKEKLVPPRSMAAPSQKEERAFLRELLMRKLWVERENIQVSQEEIDQYYEKNQSRYKQFKFSPEEAKSGIRRQLHYEKSNQKEKEYMDNLWKSARIEIMATNSKKEDEEPAPVE